MKRGLKCPYPSHWIYPEFCIEVLLARGPSFLERPYNFICFFFDGGSVFMSSSASASVVSASIAHLVVLVPSVAVFYVFLRN